jgi:hypothetical protein
MDSSLRRAACPVRSCRFADVPDWREYSLCRPLLVRKKTAAQKAADKERAQKQRQDLEERARLQRSAQLALSEAAPSAAEKEALAEPAADVGESGDVRRGVVWAKWSSVYWPAAYLDEKWEPPLRSLSAPCSLRAHRSGRARMRTLAAPTPCADRMCSLIVPVARGK